MRYVPWGKLLRDEDDSVIGTLGLAFRLRDDEEYLSATWCDYFAGGPEGDIRCAAEAIRASDFKPSPKGHFAIAVVAEVAAHMKAGGRKLRFVHEPDGENVAHVAVRGWSNEDLDLLDRLAEDVWGTVYSKAQIDAIDLKECAVNARGAP